jgi:hypothetical protein
MLGVKCFRCGRTSPKVSIAYVNNVPLGPKCLDVLKSRIQLRGTGSNSCIRETIDGIPYPESDETSKICPEGTACIECVHFSDQYCPLEIHLINSPLT